MVSDDLNNKTILVSRTDAIGDVILTFPLLGLIKNKFPKAKILFLGREYTRDIIECCEHIDEFINYSSMQNLSIKDLAENLSRLEVDVLLHVFPNSKIAKAGKLAGIPYRVGSARRVYHFFSCNYRVNLSRRQSPFHEAELNILMFKDFLNLDYKAGDVSKLVPLFGFVGPKNKVESLPGSDKRVILHPGSRGSARNWPISRFVGLAEILSSKGYQPVLTGTESEARQFREAFSHVKDLVDLTGTLSLHQLIGFISTAQVLVAASTGPLHIAAISGIHAIGIYPPMRPIHPARWAPIGSHAKVFVDKKNDCTSCRNKNSCPCVEAITEFEVFDYIQQIQKN